MGKAPCKGGQQSSGKVTKDTIIHHLPDQACVDTAGNAVTLACGCDPDKATKHRCSRRCRCGGAVMKYVMASCQCRRRCGCILPLWLYVSTMEADGSISSVAGSGVTCDDVDREDDDAHYHERDRP